MVEKSWCACWPGTSVCGRGRKAGRSIVVSVLFWPEGRKPWKWGVESRRKKCHSSECEGDLRLVSSSRISQLSNVGSGSLSPRVIFRDIILS